MAVVTGNIPEIAPGSVASLSVEGQPVAVANVGGKLYAFTDVCTHAGCPLSSGPLEGTTITCLCHGSKFDVTTGAVVTGPARDALETHAIQVAGAELSTIEGEAASAPPHADAAPAESILAQVHLFSGLDHEAIERLEAFTFRRTFSPGDVIVEEGRTGNGLYVVLSGRVEVLKGLAAGRPQVVTTLGPGEPFGEMALLGEWKRAASVRAVEETTCLGMDRWVFLAHLNSEPQLAIKMLHLLAQRLAETNERFVVE